MTENKQQADLVLKGGTAITVDSERRVIRDAGIAVQGEDIRFVGKATEVYERYEATKLLDCTDKILIPGMVNSHVHFSGGLSRGLVPDNLGPVVSSNFLHANVSPYLIAKDEVVAAKALLLEMLKGGTTTFLEAGSFHPFETIRSEIQGYGIKGMMGKRNFDLVSLRHSAKLMESTDDILKIQERLLKEFRDPILPIKPHVTIVGMGRYTDRLVIEAKKMADRYGVPLHMHLALHLDNVHWEIEERGCRPVEHLEKLGVLDSNVILVHMLYVTQKEVDILAKRGTKVVHCPTPALKTGWSLGFGRFPEMLHAGIPVAIGSDSSNCSNHHDMFRIMFLAAVLYKGIRCDPALMGAEQAIEMATINGAKTMGLEKNIGSLEVGKKADIAIIDTNRLEFRPLYNEVQSLVYSANAEMVESVIINGKVIMEKRNVLTANEEEILAEVRDIEQRLKHKFTVPIISPWKFM